VGPGLGRYGEEVRRAENVADGLDAAADTRIRPVSLQVLHVAAGSEQGGEVPAGRAAPGAEMVGVEAVFRGVGPEEADGGLAVLDLGRKWRGLAEPIVDAGDRVPAPQELHRRSWPAVLAPAPPGTAVDPDDQRAGGLALRREVEVQRVALLVGPVSQVALDRDSFGQRGRLGLRPGLRFL